jgi:magnesium chelatase family protein
VEAAHRVQLDRQGKVNADLAAREMESRCVTSAEASALLKRAIERLALSARSYHRILKVARTIADLSGEARIEAAHVAEAVQYRRLEAAR